MEKVSLIEILGPGCGRCQETYRIVREVVEAAGLACHVDKNTSAERRQDLGVLMTPAVAFDGRVVLAGRIPSAEDVRRLLDLG